MTKARAASVLTAGAALPVLAGKAVFDLMKARHDVWMTKYPNTPEARDYPLQGLENPRPEIKALGQPRMNGKNLPFDPLDVIKKVKGWEGSEFDRAD